jgi:hypothetical protein
MPRLRRVGAFYFCPCVQREAAANTSDDRHAYFRPSAHVYTLPYTDSVHCLQWIWLQFDGLVTLLERSDNSTRFCSTSWFLTFHGSIDSIQIHLLISSFPKKDLRHCQSFTPASWLLKASAALFFPSFLSTLALFNSFSHNLTCLASSFFLLSSSSALSFLINSLSFSVSASIAASLCSESILQFSHFCFEVSGSMGRIHKWMEPVRQ